MSNQNLADISAFESIQNQSNTSLGGQMSVFNADPKTIAALKKDGEEITKKVTALGDELIKQVKTQKLNSNNSNSVLAEYKLKFMDLRKQFDVNATKKYDPKNDKDLESVFSNNYFNLEQIFYPKMKQAMKEASKNNGT
jgi:hypothetical protein